MISLNAEQIRAIDFEDNLVVTACPGSGKTRVLTQKVVKALVSLDNTKRRVVAVTFTNRAADEIKSRIDALDVDHSNLWAGTLHSFAIEWILRPYAPYVDRLRLGFRIADEFYTERLLSEVSTKFGISRHKPPATRRARDGRRQNTKQGARALIDYDETLERARLVDYDDVLYLAFRILADNLEIAQTLSRIVALFCIDEIQDTQDLQYGIISSIVRAGKGQTKIFCVGDEDQAIYDSLGAVAKEPNAIASEFGFDAIEHKVLTGNYRSTQRIIDLYKLFRSTAPNIIALSSHANERGRITFRNQTCSKDELPETVAACIRESLDAGVPESEICVVAPHWWHVRGIAHGLAELLPDVSFDATGLSPFHAQRDSIWFKIARLFLTTPSPSLYATRMRWAWEVISDLKDVYDVSLPSGLSTARRFLRATNGIQSEMDDGIEYLDQVFSNLSLQLKISQESHWALLDSQAVFFDKARKRVVDSEAVKSPNVSSLRKLFKHPSGITVDTCHGIKGEEYDTVIAFGLLRGYVPNWNDIIDGSPTQASERESKLLYVLGSRAKRRLHLIAESGRFTQGGNPYETSTLLNRIRFSADSG